jgi:hypothetical protein
MTPAELAPAANIEQEDLEALEAGRLVPADDLLLALSAGLGIDDLGGYLDTAACLAAFGRRLRELREKRGPPQDALAREQAGSLVERVIDRGDLERAALTLPA